MGTAPGEPRGLCGQGPPHPVGNGLVTLGQVTLESPDVSRSQQIWEKGGQCPPRGSHR